MTATTRWLILHVSLAVGVCACGGQDVTGPGQTTRSIPIQGRVMDFASRAAVPGVSVEFRPDFDAAGTSAVTDVDGRYDISVSSADFLTVFADGKFLGEARARRSAYRGNLLINGGTCVARYGTLADARTGAPVANASVEVGGRTSISGSDGWYFVDLGCPASGTIGFNTAFLTVTHPAYVTAQAPAGRGISGVNRQDLELERR